MSFSHAEASKNIITFATEGRLVQSAWHTKHEGREMACLLGSIHPSVTRPSDCNGDLMPMWLAELTPTMFDGLPSSSVQAIGMRYGSLVSRWHVLKDENWNKVLNTFLIKLVDTALESARSVAKDLPVWAQVETSSKQVIAALKSGNKEELAASEAASEAASWAASEAARAASWTASWAASEAASWAARAASWAASWAASEAASWAASEAARAASWAASWAARAASWAASKEIYSNLFTFLLDQIELEILYVELKS